MHGFLWFTTTTRHRIRIRQRPHNVSLHLFKTNENFTVPDNPQFRVNNITGDIFVRDLDNPSLGEVLIPKSVTDTMFVRKLCNPTENPVPVRELNSLSILARLEAIGPLSVLMPDILMKKMFMKDCILITQADHTPLFPQTWPFLRVCRILCRFNQ